MKNLFVCLSLVTLLAGCVGVEEEVPVVEEEKPSTSSEYAPYVQASYGLELVYPSGWMIEDSVFEGGMQVSMSNIAPADGPVCKDGFAGLIVASNTRATEMDFDAWIESKKSDVVGLGQISGEVTKMEFSGYPAYKVEQMGWETGCPAFGYIVDYSEGRNDGRVVEVVVARDENDFDAVTQTDEMLNNITLSGSRL